MAAVFDLDADGYRAPGGDIEGLTLGLQGAQTVTGGEIHS